MIRKCFKVHTGILFSRIIDVEVHVQCTCQLNNLLALNYRYGNCMLNDKYFKQGCGSGSSSHFNADPDPDVAFYFYAVPDPAPLQSDGILQPLV
jgi:hypothetical protein